MFEELSTTLKTNDIGMVLKASHNCIYCRGKRFGKFNRYICLYRTAE
ncbi:hypothetical protein DHD80_19820 [Gramella sp. AN32]|nr:hypothetical protein [Gramella sp. AN32]